MSCYREGDATNWADDHIEIWEVFQCRACLVKGYIDFLLNQKNKAADFLKMCPFMFFGSVAGLWLDRLVVRYEGGGKLDNLSPIEFFACSVFGMLMIGVLGFTAVRAPLVLLRYIRNSRNLERTRQTSAIPKEKTAEAFLGEGQRILEAKQYGIETVYGQFDLPAFRKRYEYPTKVLNRLGGGERISGERKVIAAAETREKLAMKLPAEWKENMASEAEHS